MFSDLPLLDRATSRLPAVREGRPNDDEMALHIERLRAAAHAWPPAERHFSLQHFDLARLKARLGPRWPELRQRAIALLQSGLARHAGPDDLQLDDGDTGYFAIRAAPERGQIERQAGLLAAEVTARLCGTIPGGAIIRVTTLPLDPDWAFAGLGSAAHLVERLGEFARGGSAIPAAMSSLPGDLRAGFRPILQLRKRLVSAYRLTPRLGGRCQEAALAAASPLALDSWAMHQVLELLQEPPQLRDPALVVPVHYPTLATMGARETYSQLGRQLPQRSRRQLIIEVLDLPEGLARARVQELLSHLRPLCLALVVRVPRLPSAIEHLLGCGVYGLSVAANWPVADTSMQGALTTLAGSARIAGMRSMLVDVPNPGLCRTAHAAGIDHVCGDLLMPPLTRLGRAFIVSR